MAIAANLSSVEVLTQVEERFAGKYLEARLISANGVAYNPGITDDAAFLANEVAIGTAGYKRQIIYYSSQDVGAYADDGVGLATKSTVFAHDGSAAVLGFSHVALVWSSGNVTALTSPTQAVPTSGIDGTYSNIPVDTTSGSGSGLILNIEVQNSGAANSDFILTIQNAGRDYVANEVVTILESTLVSAGVVAAGAGNLVVEVDTVSTANQDSGEIFSVARTTSEVQLTAGREAIFYWNLKQYDMGVIS